jgi:hypothetical protein
MKVRELIKALKQIDPELVVCGESETMTWEISADEFDELDLADRRYWADDQEKEGRVLILGYRHGR